MLLIKKIHSFGASKSEMVHLWILYCRSILEQSAVVWSSTLTEQNQIDLERTQKCFLKLVLGNNYTNYEDSLLKLNIQSLEQRRKELTLKFAKSCLKNPKFRDLFPEASSETNTRYHEKYQIPFCHTNRLMNSSIIRMLHQLNEEHLNTATG